LYSLLATMRPSLDLVGTGLPRPFGIETPSILATYCQYGPLCVVIPSGKDGYDGMTI
jgi:hypothetical protein